MKLRNEFTVAAPVDQTWSTLLDIQRVAECLPGASLLPENGEGVYRGTMKVRLGGMTLEYRGTARLAEVDDDERVAAIDVKGKEARGQGTASATIRNRVVADGDRSRVLVETDLNVTGRQAQFGRGIMEDVATKMLGDFAARLEREIREPSRGDGEPSGGNGSAPEAVRLAAPAEQPPSPKTTSRTPADDDHDVLDIGAAVGTSLAKRAGVGGAVLLVLLLGWLVRPRSKGLSVTVRYR
jgi:carbon monoxide dehydrogenase subunit G